MELGADALARLLAAQGRGSAPGLRLIRGRWDGAQLFPMESPGVGLAAENAAGALAPGSLVYALKSGPELVVIGPTAVPAQVVRGSSPNGSWVRYPDGTQLCHIRTERWRVATAPYGPLHQGTKQWLFPAPFVEPPVVSCDAWMWLTGASWPAIVDLNAGTTTAVSAVLRGLDVAARTESDFLTVAAHAIGRWK